MELLRSLLSSVYEKGNARSHRWLLIPSQSPPLPGLLLVSASPQADLLRRVLGDTRIELPPLFPGHLAGTPGCLVGEVLSPLQISFLCLLLGQLRAAFAL